MTIKEKIEKEIIEFNTVKERVIEILLLNEFHNRKGIYLDRDNNDTNLTNDDINYLKKVKTRYYEIMRNMAIVSYSKNKYNEIYWIRLNNDYLINFLKDE